MDDQRLEPDPVLGPGEAGEDDLGGRREKDLVLEAAFTDEELPEAHGNVTLAGVPHASITSAGSPRRRAVACPDQVALAPRVKRGTGTRGPPRGNAQLPWLARLLLIYGHISIDEQRLKPAPVPAELATE